MVRGVWRCRACDLCGRDVERERHTRVETRAERENTRLERGAPALRYVVLAGSFTVFLVREPYIFAEKKSSDFLRSSPLFTARSETVSAALFTVGPGTVVRTVS